MTDPRIEAFQRVLEEGTGAEVVVEPDSSGLRSGLRTYFRGFTPNQGPLFTLAPAGLTRHRVTLKLGSFSGPLVDQMKTASTERRQLARALVQELAARLASQVAIAPDQGLDDWVVSGSDFAIDLVIRNIPDPASEDAVLRTAREAMVPLMAAMAELIGYDEAEPAEYDAEGRVTAGTVTRRERSPRNRLLCLSIHGCKCAVCGFVPDEVYGEAGSIIEVHHREPVSLLENPRPYNPSTDLLPLCPNCHRAVHTRRPVPYSPDELRDLLRDVHD